VTLSKVSKKGREWKEGVVESVRDAVEKYPSIYVFRYKDMKNKAFKGLREKLRDSSRFFLGSNKVLQVALGKEASDEVRENASKLSEHIKGHVGLLFTELAMEKVKEEFESVRAPEFAKAGHKANDTISYTAGPLTFDDGRKLEHTLEPSLRKNGMPTKLNKGVVELLQDHTVCEKGESLSPAQVAVLRVFGIKMSSFEMRLLCKWEDGAFEMFDKEADFSEDSDDSDNEDLEELDDPFKGY
jgi:mRNA turnover protein 4